MSVRTPPNSGSGSSSSVGRSGAAPIVFATTGDSILDQGQVNTASSIGYTANGPLTWVRALTAGRVNYLIANNFAVSGAYLAGNPGQIEQQMLTLAASPGKVTDVLFDGGTNDLQAGTTVATMQASEKRGIAALLAAGLRVWVLPLTPRTYLMTTQFYQRQQEMNDWRREYCARSRSDLRTSYGWAETGRLVYVDVMHLLIDQVTGLPLSGINVSDNVHLTAKACKIIGNFIATQINKEIPPSNKNFTSFYDYYSSDHPNGNILTAGISVATAVISAAGAAYVVGDTITLANGVVLKVLTVSATAVATVAVTNPGYKSGSAPSNPQAQVSTSGVGTGATFTLAWVSHNLGMMSGSGGNKQTLNGITPTGNVADAWNCYRAAGASTTTTMVMAKENPRTDGLTGERQSMAVTIGGTGGTSSEIYQLLMLSALATNFSIGDVVVLTVKVEITGTPVNLTGVAASCAESGNATNQTISDMQQGGTVFPNEAGVYYLETPAMTLQALTTSLSVFLNVYFDATSNSGNATVLFSDVNVRKLTAP